MDDTGRPPRRVRRVRSSRPSSRPLDSSAELPYGMAPLLAPDDTGEKAGDDTSADPIASALSRDSSLRSLRRSAPRDSRGLARELPVLPVRNAVLLPHMLVPLYLDREPALRAVEEALAHDRHILIVAQRSEAVTDPTPGDVYSVGTECFITRTARVPDGANSVLVQGIRRFRIRSWLAESPCGRVRGLAFDDPPGASEQAEALMRTMLSSFESCTKLGTKYSEDDFIQALSITSPGALADFVLARVEPPLAVRQELLETFDVSLRLRRLCQVLRRELRVLELEQQIQSDVQSEVDRTHREYLLREQLKVIQRELAEHDPTLREHVELQARIEGAGMPETTQARALAELRRLEQMPSMAPEQAVLRTYLDWLVAVPWKTRSTDTLDLAAAAHSLDTHHFGLEKVKERVLEFLAVRTLAPQGRTPILCLVGPPGVGKTSLGRSIAEALGRRFVRVSLGGVRDEAEIRGHRRTYVGALPGRIIQAMKTAGTTNPVFVLDEVDKLAADYRGDPAAALLEVLDPEQNSAFSDHYLEVPYDLSGVLFVLTANVLHTIPPALRDRMEVIEIAGYTEEEKVAIAQQFLMSRQMRDAGLAPSRVELSEDAVRRIIREYTFEAGVRGLEREIASVMRRIARRVAEGNRAKATVSARRVPDYLGSQKYWPTDAEERDQVGVATGLAWTAAGGDLTTVEVMAVPGRGGMTLTGQLGDVMKESAHAALTFTRARASALGLSEAFHESNDLHVHLPAGGIPKDGPSAGVTMAVAMVSALTGRLVRRDVAMTGEITLRGRILPVGGVKEKVLAAHRAGVGTVILPRRNLKDLDDVHPDVRERLTFIPVNSMDEVLDCALRASLSAAPASPPRRVAATTRPRPSATPRPVADPLAPASRVARPRARRGEGISEAAGSSSTTETTSAGE
ncbi:MAG TPA: endopeptidase La [Ktedonobacterales bacterium]